MRRRMMIALRGRKAVDTITDTKTKSAKAGGRAVVSIKTIVER